ncbi:membrane protein [Xanthomonas oryzae pv. oryzicola]|nr:membrane protein [Xanthomonas oryzae pv. oryzicola]
MFALLQFLVPSVFGGLFAIAAAAMGNENGPGALAWLIGAVMMIVCLALIVPAIAVTVRRLHDQDKSGWCYLISLVPYVGAFVLLVFVCIEGTPGPNQYGENPKQ